MRHFSQQNRYKKIRGTLYVHYITIGYFHQHLICFSMFFICMETKSNMYFLVFARYSLRVSDASQIFKRYNAQMPRGLQVVIFLHFGLLSVLRLTL